MSGYPNVAVWPRGRYNPVDADERDDFFDSLYHSRAVVGINTSAMVEAAIIGRPVHSIVADEFAGTQEGTIHFHHLLPEHGGFLRIGRGFDHHMSLLAASLRRRSRRARADAALRGVVHAAARPRPGVHAARGRRGRAGAHGAAASATTARPSSRARWRGRCARWRMP